MPAERVVEWVAGCVGGGAVVVSVRPLHGEQGPWRVTVEVGGRRQAVVLRAVTPRIDAAMIATGAAALAVAEEYGVPAPRLLGVDLDVPASVETMIGSTTWPAKPDLGRVRAALDRVHVPLEATPELPLRIRPIAVDDFARDRRVGAMPTTPLLRLADDVVRGMERPEGPIVFLHGDVWPGNVAWVSASECVLIDWKTAGVGDPGVDFGELRKQMAITYGLRATGGSAYWDVVAALNTPTVLDWAGATERRDAFLRDALNRLGGVV
ncbi:phosphotransferase family protein [Kribbella sp. NPDC056345]|uniref:phosphotransferase family protein n=1 Tax=Kribbella sp. NPDC056345 TaxID=3345789 RepID=UPI0035DE2668